jgi:hypothetical protein
MRPIGTLLLVFGLTVGGIQHASAFELIPVNPSGVSLDGTATFQTGFGANAGIRLPDGSVASFALGFVLPQSYITGSPIRVAIAWHTNAATSCAVELRPNFISVARVGRTHIVGPGASTGLSPATGSTILAASATNVTNAVLYNITSPDGVTPLQAFDVINFGLFRPADVPGDTCAGNLVIQGIVLAIGS